jgi:xanthine dehydrogenase YagT iron-sulfur-binding subunit
LPRPVAEVKETQMPLPDLSRRGFLAASSAAMGGLGNTLTGHGARAQSGPATPARGAAMLTTTMLVNRRQVSATHEARVSLLDLLREQLQLTGTKKGCNEGACGACTVLLDGARVNACMTLAASCDGREVTTVEGLAAADGTLDAVQRSFIDQDAFQCGYCTPGQLVSAVACIREGHAGSEAEIAEWMSGNICRCAAYPQIVAAVQQAAAALEG